MTKSTALAFESLERRDTPSTTPVAPGLLLAVGHVDRLVDRFHTRADAVLHDVAADLGKHHDAAADLGKLDHLADRLGVKIHDVIHDVFADIHPTGVLKSDLNAITRHTHTFEKTADALLDSIDDDLAHKKSAAADLLALDQAIDRFDATIDHDVKQVRTDLGILKLDVGWFKAAVDLKGAEFGTHAAAALKSLAVDLSAGKSVADDLAHIDHLADRFGHEVNLAVDLVLADGGTKAEQVALKTVRDLMHAFEKTLDQDVQAIKADVAKHVSPAADVHKLQQAVSDYLHTLAQDVKAIP